MSLREFRCKACNRFLLKEDVLYGQFVVKCKCGIVNQFIFMPGAQPPPPEPALAPKPEKNIITTNH